MVLQHKWNSHLAYETLSGFIVSGQQIEYEDRNSLNGANSLHCPVHQWICACTNLGSKQFQRSGLGNVTGRRTQSWRPAHIMSDFHLCPGWSVRKAWAEPVRITPSSVLLGASFLQTQILFSGFIILNITYFHPDFANSVNCCEEYFFLNKEWVPSTVFLDH